MKNLIRATMLAALLLACGSPLAQVPIIIGPQPPPHVIHVLPPRPGPEFVWVGGYWYPVGSTICGMRVLDSPTVAGSLLGCTSLRWRAVFRRLLVRRPRPI